MDPGLTTVYTITEPWTESEEDVARYLNDLNIKFTMEGISGSTFNDIGCIVYTAIMTAEDATCLMMVFPGISIRSGFNTEMVSMFMQGISNYC